MDERQVAIAELGNNADAFLSKFESLIKARRDISTKLTEGKEAARNELFLLLLEYGKLPISLLNDLQITVHGPKAKSRFSAYLLVDAMKRIIRENPRIQVRDPIVVREGDEFSLSYETDNDGSMKQKLVHCPDLDNSDSPIRLVYVYYAIDGDWEVLVVPRQRLNDAEKAASSKAVWGQYPVAQSKNVALRVLMSKVPMEDVITHPPKETTESYPADIGPQEGQAEPQTIDGDPASIFNTPTEEKI